MRLNVLVVPLKVVYAARGLHLISVMALPFNFLDSGSEEHELVPELAGFRYDPQLIEPFEQDALVAGVRELPFREFDFHGYKGKRRVVSFGWQYEFSGGGRLRKADDIPEFLLGLRMRAAVFAHLKPEALQHVLVTEYGPGAGIGWHRDKAVFGQVVGVSLLAPCVLRFRRRLGGLEAARKKVHAGTSAVPVKWERVKVLAEPRSAYFLTGAARSEWEHSILRVNSLRYSVTFRTMREDE